MNAELQAERPEEVGVQAYAAPDPALFAFTGRLIKWRTSAEDLAASRLLAAGRLAGAGCLPDADHQHPRGYLQDRDPGDDHRVYVDRGTGLLVMRHYRRDVG